VRVLERPAAVVATPLLEEVERLVASLVVHGAGAAQVVESPQHVVVPAGWEGEQRPEGIADLSGGPAAEQTTLEEVGTPAR